MHTVVREVLTGAIDYAGLFPPASLPLSDVVANYAAYRSGPEAWALGRLVLPEAQLAACLPLARAGDTARQPWPVSALVPDAAAVGRLDAFNRLAAGVLVVDAAEGRATRPEEVDALAAARPAGITVFVEVALDATMEPCLDRVAATGLSAKIRTGGVVHQAFPPVLDVVRFLRACHARRIPFKATAGLHHPIRGDYRLTYEAGSASGIMYGYLNIFLAAAAIEAGADDDAVVATLRATEAVGRGGTLELGRSSFDVDATRRARAVLAGFGSCSFREPLDDLQALGLS